MPTLRRYKSDKPYASRQSSRILRKSSTFEDLAVSPVKRHSDAVKYEENVKKENNYPLDEIHEVNEVVKQERKVGVVRYPKPKELRGNGACVASTVTTRGRKKKTNEGLKKLDSSCGSEKPEKKASQAAVNGKHDEAKQVRISNYFAGRMTMRQNSLIEKKIAEEKERDDIYYSIKNNVESGLNIRDFEEKGRGIVANKEFASGEFVVEYAGNLLGFIDAVKKEKYYEKYPEKYGSYMYFFIHKQKKYCVDATKESGRLGRLINHSKTRSNLKTDVIEVDGVPRLYFKTTRQITIDEELLYDYGERRGHVLQEFEWLSQ